MFKMFSKVKKHRLGRSKEKPGGKPDGNDGNSSLDQPPVATRLAASDIDPWERAYMILLDQQHELMADYAKHLSNSQGGTTSSADLSVPQFVEDIVQGLLKDREDKQWRISLLGKNIKVREQAENLVKFLLWTDPTVKGVLSAQPYAQLAWSGVSSLLPVSKAFA